jgi:2-polyprenyl-3-methyl-5-hydroxy-6-metoxy-1,4-benzoquinol methylase
VFTFYKLKGLKLTIVAIVKGIWIRVLYRAGLEIKFVDRQKVKNLELAESIFKNRNLKFDTKGFWYVNPMPTKKELDEYYNKAYWGSINPRNFGISMRDFRHYYLLLKLVPDFNSATRKILNFGAGHGGLSVILNLLGHHVVNIEPSEMICMSPINWKKKNSIKGVEDKGYDLIYGSHSLEHVQNFQDTYETILNLSKHDAIHFWEVPNADCQYNGANMNRIDIPHTYYFTGKFFEYLFKEVMYLCKYDKAFEDSRPPFSDIVECNGNALVVVGKVN